MTGFNAALDPWIGGVRDGAPSEESILSALEGRFTVATGDALTDHAVHRLLLAVTYTALGSPAEFDPARFDAAPVAEWVRANAGLFSLTDPDQPFLQDPTVDRGPVPAMLLRYQMGKDRPMLVDFRSYLTPSEPLSWAEATRLLVQNLCWDVYGVHKGTPSLCTAPLTGRAAVRPGGPVADALAWSWVPVPAVGRARWTYEHRETYLPPKPKTGQKATVIADGAADGLVWLSRRYRLFSTDDGSMAEKVATMEGWRFTPPNDPISLPWGHMDTIRVIASADGDQPHWAATYPYPALLGWWWAEKPSLPGWIRSAATADFHPEHIVLVQHHTNQSKQDGVTMTVLPDEATRVDPRPLHAALSGLTMRDVTRPVGVTARMYDDPDALTDPEGHVKQIEEAMEVPAPPDFDLFPQREEPQDSDETSPATNDGDVPDHIKAQMSYTSPEGPAITAMLDPRAPLDGQEHRTHIAAMFHAIRRREPAAATYYRNTTLPMQHRMLAHAIHEWFWGDTPTPVSASGHPRWNGSASLPLLMRQVDPQLVDDVLGYSLNSLGQPLRNAVDQVKRTGYCPSWAALYLDLCVWGTPAQHTRWNYPTSPSPRKD